LARIVLKIDVDTLRGTREGVPNLARIFDRFKARATFLFSLGPDHTGWAMRRVLRPGFLQKVSRTSVVEHYGIKQLMYGVLLPGPDIGVKSAAEMRAIHEAGFECGIHTWDHVYWQDNVRSQDREWTIKQMQKSYNRFVAIFGAPPITHGAAGWQMNGHAFEQIDAWGMQLPTTLPTLDEVLGVDGVDEHNVAASILKRTENNPHDQVFTLHAELEGQKLAPIFEQLLDGWRAQGHTFATMGDYHATLDRDTLPSYPVTWGEIPGRSGELIVQPS
jgi:undecaprenyl phosphate-alpha-L-ara4FN deformylase